MKILGIIAEYNPFHNGHKYHIEESKKQTNSTHTIAIISGSFVQRGDVSIIDKWTKAKIAISNGVDLVIELPTVYSVQTAELFGYGAVKILNSLKCVDIISFGSEAGKVDILKNVAHTLNKEPIEFKKILKNELKKGVSFPEARVNALCNFYSSNNLEIGFLNLKELLNNPNNILAIEYLKALHKLSSSIEPFTITRLGSSYNEENLQDCFASATAIRKSLSKKDKPDISSYVPDELNSYLNNNPYLNNINNYIDILNYNIISSTEETLSNIMDIDENLQNRILNLKKYYNSIDELSKTLYTKNYTHSRINRILMHMLLNLKSEDIKYLYNVPIKYVRVLGSNKKGFEIINKIKENSDVEVLTKFSDYKLLNSDIINKFLNYEINATNLYYLPTKDNSKFNLDFFKTPYIKK